MDHSKERYKLNYSEKPFNFYELSLTKKEAERLINIMPDDNLKNFCRLHFLEKLTLEETAEKTHYSKRQAERINKALKNYALKVLLQNPRNNAEALITIKHLAEKMLKGGKSF